ncbi:MAG: hypothetical protein M1274_02235 [Actinobacteria bacterium]|nr:hypothetical protein [Actinomycetota bacterium]
MSSWRLLSAVAGRIGRRGVLLIDGLLVRHYGVKVIADDPQCILRVSSRILEKPVTLSDDAELAAGTPVIEIHFWNEHLPQIGEGGADFAWAKQFMGRLSHSLDLLAVYALSAPEYSGFVAIHGQLIFIPTIDVALLKRTAARLGFTTIDVRAAPGLRFWTAAFWTCLYTWWLMWTFNPNSLRAKQFRDLAITDLWMSREALLGRLGRRGGD